MATIAGITFSTIPDTSDTPAAPPDTVVTCTGLLAVLPTCVSLEFFPRITLKIELSPKKQTAAIKPKTAP